MGLLDSFRTLAGDGRGATERERRSGTWLFECRDCGAKFSAEPESCEDCGSTEIASYVFS